MPSNDLAALDRLDALCALRSIDNRARLAVVSDWRLINSISVGEYKYDLGDTHCQIPVNICHHMCGAPIRGRNASAPVAVDCQVSLREYRQTEH